MKDPKVKVDIPSSFRDPSGVLFLQNGVIYRRINTIYRESYDYLMNSGLYKALVDEGLLIAHEEVNTTVIETQGVYKIIKPELIPFISYSYEWSFSQLKDAALVTLKIQKKALDFGMSLKDCSAYNIQFLKGKPILIDTLSFERYREGQPWIAYRQFCQHFLAPLVLMSYRDIRLQQLLRIYIDGIPLNLASSLLPSRSYFTFSLFSHLHLHAKSQQVFANKAINVSSFKMNRSSFLGIIDSLETTIKKLKWQPSRTEWSAYYGDTNYSLNAFEHKKEIVARYLDKINPRSVWDLGANTGVFSRLASDKGMPTISFDNDPLAVEKNYLECIKKREAHILPLLFDLSNPSPNIGWQNQERMSIFQRGPADTAFALALIHHLVISNNLPFNKIAEFFSKICKALIIEFVPKDDSQVKRLLKSREDIFSDYRQELFEDEFARYFKIQDSREIRDSKRILYFMERR